MKKYAICVLILYIVLLIIPLPMLNTGAKKNSSDSSKPPETSSPPTTPTTQTTLNSENSNSGTESENSSKGTFKLLLSEKDEVVEISERDFIIGTIATEMSPTNHSEAFKAQAVAAYTYYSVQRNKQLDKPNEALKGADFADSQAGVLIYRDDANLRERWGDKYDSNYKKISEAVDAVIGKIITYNDKIITAVYHSINSGITEDAVTIWGADYPYLKPVASPGDELSPDYEKMVSFTKSEFEEKIKKLSSDTKLDENPENWISDKIKSTDSNTVTEIQIGDKKFTGREIREAFGLRSACFKVSYSDEKFLFTTYGYGHGVGMSQYGADYMARQGSSWEEIIKTYYAGVAIK